MRINYILVKLLIKSLDFLLFRDFGSIFSTLLPGTMAKLDPPEGGSFLDGLEVRVAFGSVWKQSLSELSGGQRSLLALSLILALLLFKPAPLYILDEVHLSAVFAPSSRVFGSDASYLIQYNVALHTNNWIQKSVSKLIFLK